MTEPRECAICHGPSDSVVNGWRVCRSRLCCRLVNGRQQGPERFWARESVQVWPTQGVL